MSARNVAGEAGAPIRLAIEVVPPSNKQIASTYLLGLPPGARVSDATHTAAAAEEESVIEVTRWNLPELSITVQPGQVGTFAMRVAAMSDAVDGGAQQVVSSGFTVSTQVPDPHAPRHAVRTQVSLIDKSPTDGSSTDGATVSRSTAIHVPAPEPAAAPPSTPKPPRPEPRPEAIAPTPPAAPPPASASSPSAAAPVAAAEPGATALVGRAEQLIRRGDISGARLVLERALSRNEPRAALLLAQTYDPIVLRTWKVLGLRPDPERAQALYAQAARDNPAQPTNLAASPR
ncbi:MULTISPECIES: hypothetical protein [Methylobacterium]|uniref:hypothetical protein n=1 Tax=Methylobacterium TaxID=407 RepID=UPI0013EC6FC6|nr:hypothetical protein [Methylobacterium sp. DB0501]NGM34045.1 hypothetical protein [Methylobacterium sp. DB0501]